MTTNDFERLALILHTKPRLARAARKAAKARPCELVRLVEDGEAPRVVHEDGCYSVLVPAKWLAALLARQHRGRSLVEIYEREMVHPSAVKTKGFIERERLQTLEQEAQYPGSPEAALRRLIEERGRIRVLRHARQCGGTVLREEALCVAWAHGHLCGFGTQRVRGGFWRYVEGAEGFRLARRLSSEMSALDMTLHLDAGQIVRQLARCERVAVV